ncbi:polyprenyl synthetase [Nitritalea halalkaliphila LW7]|uniref:Polyprenyl synthetase n=1 Tax=Nitritalea halalkaliphila LW7 TaxID=1189621 RepID=I5CA44_9BACT|nr:polyprenyl synthetase family protein [Nitritalea halalkaliphila]EIM78696.1 polyprenyl synthetase [Nitritalea halalkaliphila LW7]
MTLKTRDSVQDLQRAIEEKITQYPYGAEPESLYEPIRYLLAIGGKRLRPVLTLLGYRLFASATEEVLTPAAAVEVFHNFTLMHDDIMDKAPLRRGKPTVHERWDANTAILSGDVMLVKAYDMLLEMDGRYLKQMLLRFNRTAAEVCEGQQLDMNFEQMDTVSEEQYIHMIRLKTAVLLGFALELGATLGGASKEEVAKLYDFGVYVGIGFQLMDDLLDVYADQEKFGKQVGGDIIANKKTFLLLKALELADGELKDRLDVALHTAAFSADEKVHEVTAIYDALGIKQITEKKMNDYFERGFAALAAIDCPHPEAKATLEGLTRGLITREY